jgi:hypothetical protein
MMVPNNKGLMGVPVGTPIIDKYGKQRFPIENSVSEGAELVASVFLKVAISSLSEQKRWQKSSDLFFVSSDFFQAANFFDLDVFTNIPITDIRSEFEQYVVTSWIWVNSVPVGPSQTFVEGDRIRYRVDGTNVSFNANFNVFKLPSLLEDFVNP